MTQTPSPGPTRSARTPKRPTTRPPSAAPSCATRRGSSSPPRSWTHVLHRRDRQRRHHRQLDDDRFVRRQVQLPAHPEAQPGGDGDQHADRTAVPLVGDGRQVRSHLPRHQRRAVQRELELRGEPQVLPRGQGRAAGVERGQAAQSHAWDRHRGGLGGQTAGSSFRARPRARPPRMLQSTTSTTTSTPPPAAAGTTAGCSTTASAPTSTRASQANLAFTHFAAANHELKYGLDWQETKWEQDVFHNNLYFGIAFDRARAPAGSPTATPDRASPCTQADLQPGRRRRGRQGANGSPRRRPAPLYIYDRITLGDHWTFNLGLRLEDQTHENDTGRTVIDSTDPRPASPRCSTSRVTARC